MIHWTASDLIYTICSDCNSFLTWKVHPRLMWLGAVCCHRVYNAEPIREDLFEVTIRDIDKTNVITFPVKSPIKKEPA